MTACMNKAKSAVVAAHLTVDAFTMGEVVFDKAGLDLDVNDRGAHDRRCLLFRHERGLGHSHTSGSEYRAPGEQSGEQCGEQGGQGEPDCAAASHKAL